MDIHNMILWRNIETCPKITKYSSYLNQYQTLGLSKVQTFKFIFIYSNILMIKILWYVMNYGFWGPMYKA